MAFEELRGANHTLLSVSMLDPNRYSDLESLENQALIDDSQMPQRFQTVIRTSGALDVGQEKTGQFWVRLRTQREVFCC